MSYTIVVARYNENIDWLRNEMHNCIIYNKGEKLNINNEIILENVGRESETYLNYIISNYGNLPDVVIFTQGKISDHKGADDTNYLINLKNEALFNMKSYPTITHYDINNNLHWDKTWNLQNGNYYMNDNYKNNNKITFIDWFKINIKYEYPNPISIYVNGIFSIKKELILKNSLDYYKNLILEVNHHINPTEGHFFERSWYYIFN
jgi:archaellin